MIATAFRAVWTWTCDPMHQYRSWIAHTVDVVVMMVGLGIVTVAFRLQ